MAKKTISARKRMQAAKAVRNAASGRFVSVGAAETDVRPSGGRTAQLKKLEISGYKRKAPTKVQLIVASAEAVRHTEALKLSSREITRSLISSLGGTLVSTLAGSKDVKASHKWARFDGPSPRPDTEKRLRFAYEQWQKVASVEGEGVARVWFIGANPWLNYDTPVLAIRDGRLAEVNVASDALTSDAFSG